MVGSVFLHYQVVKKLGGGNTGVVYQAYDPERKRDVALKILSDNFLTSKEKRARFNREAMAAMKLDHPAVVKVYDQGEHGNAGFILMEYVGGEDFKSLIARYPDGMDVPRFRRLMLPILSGLAYAHQQGLIHRDLKPDNLKVTQDGRPKVLDFGLVKDLNRGVKQVGDSYETMTGMVVGSAGYMSPEQAQGAAIDERTDIFALGVIMYEMLSGDNPFAGRNPFETIVRIINEEPISLELLRPDLPAPLCNVVGACLAKDKTLRCATVADVHRVLHQLKGN